MKKSAVGKTAEPLAQNTGVVSRDRKLSEAIESVFRLTHGREMTRAERSLFGFADNDISELQDGNKGSSAGQTRSKRRQ